MRAAIWLLLVQASLGAFDTLYYHEYRLKLAYGARRARSCGCTRATSRTPHIGSLGFVTWDGTFRLGARWPCCRRDLHHAVGLHRGGQDPPLPPGERAMHAVMGIVYGAFLANLIPEIIGRSGPSGFGSSYHGFPAWVLSVLAAGVFVSGVRDLIASGGAARA